MFLDALRKQNQPLIDTSLGLLRQHKLTPDTWVIDVDMVEENARRILQTAEKISCDAVCDEQAVRAQSLADPTNYRLGIQRSGSGGLPRSAMPRQ